MCLFYKVYYNVFSELGFSLGVESIVRYALSIAHAVECDMEYFASEGKIVELIGYLVCDTSTYFIK